MPKRAAPGDRAAIEAALTPELRKALETLRELFDVVAWQRTPLGPPFMAAAAILEAARLRQDGHAATEALTLAAGRLGLSADTVESWARRWSADSRVQHARAARGSTGVRLVEDAAHDTRTKDEAA